MLVPTVDVKHFEKYGFRRCGVITDDNVLAWMPLPEPWRGEQDG